MRIDSTTCIHEYGFIPGAVRPRYYRCESCGHETLTRAVFITQVTDEDGRTWAGPDIPADSWADAEKHAAHLAVRLLGEKVATVGDQKDIMTEMAACGNCGSRWVVVHGAVAVKELGCPKCGMLTGKSEHE